MKHKLILYFEYRNKDETKIYGFALLDSNENRDSPTK